MTVGEMEARRADAAQAEVERLRRELDALRSGPTPPAANSCASNLGRAKSYRMPLFCGAPDSLELAGGGLPPTPVIGNVEIDVPANGNTPASKRTVPFIIGGFNPELSPIGVSSLSLR